MWICNKYSCFKLKLILSIEYSRACNFTSNIAARSTAPLAAQVTAVTEPSFADIVVLMNPATGSQTINTHLIAYIGQSANSTPVYTSALTLVEEATQGTKRIWAARNVDISALSGTNMNYKLTTHSQSASLETRVHSVSLAWR